MGFLKNNTQVLGLLFALTTALCWGVLAILLKNALYFADSKTIVAFRMIFAFLMAFPISALFFPAHLKLFKKPPLLLILGSLGLAFNYLGFMKGVELSSASNAQIMIQLGPLSLMLSGFLVYKESLTLKQALWLFLAFIGFFLFFSDQFEIGQATDLVTANVWILFAAITWVWYSLVIKHYTKKGYSSFELNLIVFLCCAFVLSFGIDFEASSKFTFSQWIFLAFLGLNTLVAYGAFGQALKYAPASQVSVIITTNPILTLLIIAIGSPLSPFIPNEPVSLKGYFGALLVILGVAFSTLLGVKSRSKKTHIDS
jgi:drug/metabolite transporter (DMT)-like permease